MLGMGRQVCVLCLSILCRRRQAMRLGLNSMLTDRWTLETHGSRLQRLSTSRSLLLRLKKTLVSPLADWSFMRPLLLLKLRPVWTQLRTTLWSHARIYLPCTGGHIVGLLVLGVWGR